MGGQELLEARTGAAAIAVVLGDVVAQQVELLAEGGRLVGPGQDGPGFFDGFSARSKRRSIR